jgi:hypothetical protein
VKKKVYSNILNHTCKYLQQNQLSLRANMVTSDINLIETIYATAALALFQFSNVIRLINAWQSQQVCHRLLSELVVNQLSEVVYAIR